MSSYASFIRKRWLQGGCWLLTAGLGKLGWNGVGKRRVWRTRRLNVDLFRRPTNITRAASALQPCAPQLRLRCITNLHVASTGCHRIATTSEPTQLVVTAAMTVVEAVKDAIGLGGGGMLAARQNTTRSSDRTQNQLGRREKRCQRPSYLWRIETVALTSSSL